ncbi:MAG: hypothetical protein LBG65_08580 [Puniceicoccales bacterium]|jgi:hypothetical protein|nr:hypothetical protein [Puniceicoccales bacterium]
MAALAAACAVPAILPVAHGAGEAERVEILTRHYLVTQYFAREGLATGGMARPPGARDGLCHANAALGVDGGWDPRCGGSARFRHATRLTAGSAWRGAGDAGSEHSFSASLGDTFLWRTKHHTELYIYADLGYQHVRRRDRAHASGADTEDERRNHPGSMDAHMLTSLMDAGISQSIPLRGTPAPGFEEEASLAWLRLSARFGNVMQYGYAGKFGARTLFVNTFAWSAGAEYLLPETTLAGHPARLAPFLALTGIHDDGNRAFSGDGRFFQAGLRATLSAPGKSEPAPPPQDATAIRQVPRLTLSLSCIWGENLSGWQLGTGITF